MKNFIFLILILFFCGCVAQRQKRENKELRGLMLLENTQLGRNKMYYNQKYFKVLKHNHKKLLKKVWK
jgi:hypothetical protein